jgi:predicted acylesterase/phospholipase RssA
MSEHVRSAVGSISLCLSGGGYRAIAFHLGTLSYLDHVGLRESIRQLSTVSGGTFVGAKYVISLMEGVGFNDFFRDYWRFLESTDLTGLGFDALDGPAPETLSGRHNVIACMARVYADTFMKDPQGRPYLFGQVLDADLPFDEIVFNATELRHGHVFRFQRSSNAAVVIGTERVRLSRDDAAKIRMADIVAASSCFPGGFEPLAFPDDFVWPKREIPAALRSQFSRDGKPAPVLLVDGCVADNPGIQSLLLSNRSDPGRQGMFIISDVDPHVEELYGYMASGKSGGPTLEQLLLYARLLLTLLLVGAVGLGAFIWTQVGVDGRQLSDVLLSMLPVLLTGVTVGAIFWVNRTVKKLVIESMPTVGAAIWGHLMKTRLHQFLDMMRLRFTSVLKVSERVYPTRIRSLVYELLDTDPAYRKKYVTNVLYELASGQPWPAELANAVPEPSPALRQVVDLAETVPITLWFDNAEQLPCLVATGQADMCFNLMQWVVLNHGAEPSAYSPGIRALWDQLVADWKKLNENPYALIETLLPGQRLARPALDAAH